MKHFIVIDMQNDFCTGTLANKDAVAIIPSIKKALQKAKAEGDGIIFTHDSHNEDYLETMEGIKLPFKHCIEGTEGWEIVPELAKEATDKTLYVDKKHFGYEGWAGIIRPGDEVTICGTCTDICVVSNALAIKMIDNVEVNVLASCCAGLNTEAHKAALMVMKNCQCNIIEE